MLLSLLLLAHGPLAPLDYWLGKCWRTTERGRREFTRAE